MLKRPLIDPGIEFTCNICITDFQNNTRSDMGTVLIFNKNMKTRFFKAFPSGITQKLIPTLARLKLEAAFVFCLEVVN